MKHRPLPLLTAGATLALTGLVGCSSVPGSPHVALKESLGPGDQYVAIGDSYTAAPGVGPLAADDGCLQSTTNYPHQVAKRLRLKLTDVSCGGAATIHVRGAQTLGPIDRPPQIEAVTRDTDLVTISLGANDFTTFFAIVNSCPTLRLKDPDGAPCADTDSVDGESMMAKRAAVIERRIVKAIRMVRARAPKARVVVVGYPQIFPTSGPCAELPLAAGDYAFARRANALLVDAQEEAAETTKADYIDVFDATKGHEICGDKPWISGMTPRIPEVLRYHPYPEEQRAVADLVVQLLR